MKNLSSILIALLLCATAQADAQTNLPPWSPTPEQMDRIEGKRVGEPFGLIWAGGVTNELVLVSTNWPAPIAKVPAKGIGGRFIVAKPAPDPRYVVKARSVLNGEDVEVTIRVSGKTGFFEGGLEMGNGINLNKLNNKFIAQVPHTNSIIAGLPQEITVVSGSINEVLTWNAEVFLNGAFVDAAWDGAGIACQWWGPSGRWNLTISGAPDNLYVSPVSSSSSLPKTGWTRVAGALPIATISY